MRDLLTLEHAGSIVSARADAQPARPDVALIIDAADPPPAVLRVAGLHAVDAGGVLHVIQVVEAERNATVGARRAADARLHLGRVVERFCAHDEGVPVTERLHFGPLPTLLETLESSVGTVVLEAGPESPRAREVASVCPVPVWFVDRTGTVITTAIGEAPAT